MKKFADDANVREQREADERRQAFDQVNSQGKVLSISCRI